MMSQDIHTLKVSDWRQKISWIWEVQNLIWTEVSTKIKTVLHVNNWKGQRKNKNRDHLKCVRHAEDQIHGVPYKDFHLSVFLLD